MSRRKRKASETPDEMRAILVAMARSVARVRARRAS